MTEIQIKDQTIIVDTPYNLVMIDKFRKIGGKWKNGEWVFDYDKNVYDSLVMYINNHFFCNILSKKIKAKITFTETVSSKKSPVLFYGFSFSTARGRDHGSKVGDGLKLIDGNIKSGGSFINWTSIVEKGSVFIIDEFPSGFKEIEFLTVELLENPPINTYKNILLKDISVEELTEELEYRLSL